MSETNKTYYWNRVGYVEIEGEDGDMHRYGGSYDGLDFKFDIKYAGDIAVTFKVGILGLGKETIQRLTVWNLAQAMSRARKIAVYAGYEKDGLARPIATGIITQAIPTCPPEMWLNFDCIIGSASFDPMPGKCIRGDRRKDILSYLGYLNGKTMTRWDATKVDPNGIVERFYVDKSPVFMLQRFADDQNISIYFEDDVIVAADRYAWLDEKKANKPEKINIDTGLLAIGNIDLVGATIRTRLNLMAKLMSWVYLESKIMPSSNNLYYVICKRHVGQYRGKDWFTELQMIRRP